MIDSAHWLAAWSSGDAEAIIELCRPDVEVVAVTLGVEGRHYSGHEGIRAWMRDVTDRFHASTRAEELELLADEALVMSGTLVVRDETIGGTVDESFAMLVRLRDEKAAWIGTFVTAAEARETWARGVA